MHERGRIICDCCDAACAAPPWRIRMARQNASLRGWAYRRHRAGVFVDLCPDHARLPRSEWERLTERKGSSTAAEKSGAPKS